MNLYFAICHIITVGYLYAPLEMKTQKLIYYYWNVYLKLTLYKVKLP